MDEDEWLHIGTKDVALRRWKHNLRRRHHHHRDGCAERDGCWLQAAAPGCGFRVMNGYHQMVSYPKTKPSRGSSLCSLGRLGFSAMAGM